ncbi:hypothetical protein WJX75_003175 [Coccomyxa subellipsoidea]|uniref:Apple domain-containing protein n=1 Tax=Coccomyxa subellipsoidea TaxID=248742 RepID=A0ABR2Z2W6_9CHLO
MPARSLSREKMTVLVGLVVLSLLTANASQLDGAASRDITSHADAELSHRSRQLLQTGTCISVPSTNFGGDVLTDGAANLQPSAGACCNSCWSQTRQAVSGGGCNAWVWCGLPAGCNNGYGTIYPYGQCTLKFQASLQALQASLNESSKFGASNFTSGWIPSWSRMVDQTPPVTAFTRFPGVDFQTAYDYNCPQSLSTAYYCQLSGDVTSLAASCMADVYCQAFVYIPTRSTGWLKGGTGVGLSSVQSLAFATPNANAVTYVRTFSS